MTQQLTFDDVESESASDAAATVELANLPANERVLLIQGIVGVMHAPSIVEGETSSTGKTISVEDEHSDMTYRLDAETIFRGDGEYRDATSFRLYTPERYQRKQKANHAPGPQVGANEVSEVADLPTPTHRPLED